MQCRDVERDVDSFVDCELAEPERLELETHLTECPGCRKLVQRLATFKATLRASAPRSPAPAALRQRVQGMLDQIDRARAAESPPPPAPPRSFLRNWAPLGVLAAAVLCALSWPVPQE